MAIHVIAVKIFQPGLNCWTDQQADIPIRKTLLDINPIEAEARK